MIYKIIKIILFPSVKWFRICYTDIPVIHGRGHTAVNKRISLLIYLPFSVSPYRRLKIS